MEDCGCAKRQAAMNAFVPGLGDQTKLFLQPIEPLFKGDSNMSADLLKPDLKAVVWLLVGAFVVPYVLKMIK